MVHFRLVAEGPVQRRFDPLTGWEVRINPERAQRPRQGVARGKARGGAEELGHLSRPSCPFCPDRVEKATPTFEPDLVPEGRLRRGESLVVPNLHPFAPNHGVIIMGQQHFRRLDEFDPALLADNLLAARDFALAVARARPGARYPVYIFNYMPPSAGSIIHPHSQVWAETRPLPWLRLLLGRSRRYFQKWGRSFWDDLVAEERRLGERFVGENASVAVLCSFAPRGFREAQFIFKGLASLTELDAAQAGDLASAVQAVLLGYQALGVGSFNLASYSAGVGEEADYFRLSFRLISRPYPAGLYTNDSGPNEKFYGFQVIDTLPEEIAASLRGYFSP